MMSLISNKLRLIACLLVMALIVSIPDFSNAEVVWAADASNDTLVNQGNDSQKDDEAVTQPVTEQIETKEPVTQPATEPVTQPVTEPATQPDVKPVIKKITPDKVTGLKVTKTKTNEIDIKWNKSKNATEYRIYRSVEKSNGKMSKAKKIKTIKSTSLKDKGLKQGTKYEYSVYAYRVVKGVKTTHSKATKISALTKPEAVSGVEVTETTRKSVSIRWNKNSKASKYIVYRADETSKCKFGQYKKIKTLKGSKNTYTDKKVAAGTLYRYKVVVQSTKGKTNTLSKGKTVKVLTDLNAPTKLKKKKSSADVIKLKWKKVKRADKYEIYRDGKLVKTTTKATYKDKKLASGVTYQYSVKAVRKYKKKTYRSEAVSIDVLTNDVINGTWVEVSIEKQMMYMYVKGKLYVKTPVVTGNAGALSTTKGHHHVLSKSAQARLVGSYNGQSWDVVVNYWLGFTGDGQGIHDSTWRSAYGGNIYKGNGSHGCVNTPLSAMKKIFDKAYVGMPVIVH